MTVTQLQDRLQSPLQPWWNVNDDSEFEAHCITLEFFNLSDLYSLQIAVP